MKSALRFISFKKKGTKISTDVRALPRGKYELTCTIIDEGYELMELKFVLDNQKQIDRMVYNFDSHPEHIYRGILALLSGLGIGTALCGVASFVFLFFDRNEFHLMSILYMILLWVIFLVVELVALILKKDRME